MASTGEVVALLPAAEGKLLLVAHASSPAYSARLLRLLATGDVDPTLRVDGVAMTDSDHWPARLALRDDGQLLLSDNGARGGHFYITRPGSPPQITARPASQTGVTGSPLSLSVTATSDAVLRYQWYRNGAPIVGATGPTYAVSSFGSADVGTYSVDVSNAFATVTVSGVRVAGPPYRKGRLLNLSVRTQAGSGEKTLILGFALGGADTAGHKALLHRGVGPTLTTYQVAGALPDPLLELYDANRFLIDRNDNWTGVFDFAAVGAFPFAGSNPKDAAIYDPYASTGAQTLHVIGKDGSSGMTLAEIYDATPAGDLSVFTPRLINGSARSQVNKGDDVLILGFVVGGEEPLRILVRAAGPTLAAPPYHLPGTLVDPQLEVYRQGGAKLASNDNWEDDGAGSTVVGAAIRVGAFALNPGSKDAALLLTLAPGAYSAVVRGRDDGTGVALVELYEDP